MTKKLNPHAKRLLVLLFSCLLCGFVLTACSGDSSDKSDEAAGTEDAKAEVTQADIEEKIIGKWIVADVNGQPALTNDKCVFTFSSPTKASMSSSFNSRPELGSYWNDAIDADFSIEDNKGTLTWSADENTTVVDELTVSDITDTEAKGRLVVKSTENGSEKEIQDVTVRIAKVDSDYSKDILGTWEGRCTSEGSAFDDGKEHRWEYKDDGTYVYYNKEGDKWVPGDDTMNEYFVDGNLLCTRWTENDQEEREWWEITIEGDTMKWTATRSNEDGTIFTAGFEMKKVEE